MISAFGVEHADQIGKGLRERGAATLARVKAGARHGNQARRGYKAEVHGLSGKAAYTVTRHPVRLALLAAGTTGGGAAVKQRYEHEKGRVTDAAVKAVTPKQLSARRDRAEVGKSAFAPPKVSMPTRPAALGHHPPKVSLTGQHSPAMTAPAAPGGLSKVKARLAPVPTPPTGP